MEPIRYIAQNQAGSLLALVFYIESKITAPRAHSRLDGAHGDNRTHLITAHAREADRFQHFNTSDNPSNCWLPQYGFEYSSCGRRGNHVITNAFHFHFWPRNACVFAPHVEHKSRHLASFSDSQMLRSIFQT